MPIKYFTMIALIVLFIGLLNHNTLFSSEKDNSSYDSYTVKSGDNIWSIAREKSVSVNDLLDLNNMTKDDCKIIIGQKLRIPKTKYNYSPNIKIKKPISDKILKNYGTYDNLFYQGITFRARPNKSITASKEGIVVFAGKVRGYGNTIIIKHYNNYFTVYSGYDLSINVHNGKKISLGEKIAYNNTNKTLNVFFQLYYNNRTKNPAKYFG